ncbi:hypothetical protein GE061_000223 [Apolygus lucorum]|uniref:Ig-like domain-containing protein n=1 Tax=Apolygus lucorum TaxID=248454 RepID=A0A8S9Y5Q4_APOLU|nr:hypothetical protein GE061_000223 [Apolygus lucorum]
MAPPTRYIENDEEVAELLRSLEDSGSEYEPSSSESASSGDEVSEVRPEHQVADSSNHGEYLSHNMSARLILIQQSLVLQKVTRSNSGLYSCVASNTQGETHSNEFLLRVKYAPTCKHDRVVIVGASRAESLDIPCHVDADPPARSFRWKFNNSGETLDVGSERFSSNGTFSVLRYTPVADLDYGTLSCWAENNIAVQSVPCLFQVVAAGKPYPVRNCTVGNETASSVVVWCLPGSDGGLPQIFLLEIYVGGSSSPRVNFTATDSPYFYLTDLEAEIPIRLIVYSVNSKGRSSPVVLDDFTLKDPQKRTGENTEVGTPPLLGVAGGAAVTFLLVIVIFVAKVRMSSRSESTIAAKKPPPPHISIKVAGKESDEKDPDIIPAKFGESFTPAV